MKTIEYRGIKIRSASVSKPVIKAAVDQDGNAIYTAITFKVTGLTDAGVKP